MYPGTGLKVCVGGWGVGILVLYFGPGQAFGLGLRLGPSRTKTGLFGEWKWCPVLNEDILLVVLLEYHVLAHTWAERTILAVPVTNKLVE